MGKWVEEDRNIVQFLINKFGVEMECDGLELYKAVVSSFMNIVLVESTSAEKEKSDFQWSSIFSSYDPIAMADKIQKFWVIRQRLDPSVKGTIKYWTEHMWTFCPVDVRMACDNILRSDVGMALSSSFWTDESVFVEVLQAALKVAGTFKDASGAMSSNAHRGGPPMVKESEDSSHSASPTTWNYHGKLSKAGNAPKPCPLCQLHKCPMAVKSGATRASVLTLEH